jgi:putative ABC transport system ATP-binding protein
MKNIISPSSPIAVNKPSATKDIIVATNVNKEFKTASGVVKVLKNMNFTVKEGSFTIIFGPSGSGKTTLMNVLSGLEPPTTGTLSITGQEMYKLDSDQRAHFRAKTTGIVHQQNYWLKSLNVLENVALPLYLVGNAKEPSLTVAQESLDRVGMAQFAKYSPTILSGGQQQRVSMARALVSSPTLILADEPTGNLDSKNGQEIMDLLTYFQKELQRTIILVTHNIEYLPLSDKQLYILDGQLTESRRGQKMPQEILQSLKLQVAELTKMENGG